MLPNKQEVSKHNKPQVVLDDGQVYIIQRCENAERPDLIEMSIPQATALIAELNKVVSNEQ